MCINRMAGNAKRRSGGWIRPETVARQYGRELGPIGIAVYTILSSHADNLTWECYPSYEKVADEIGASRRAVIDAMKRLERLGLVQVTRASNRANRYRMPGVLIGLDEPEESPAGVSEMHPTVQEMHPTVQEMHPTVQEMHPNYSQRTTPKERQQQAAAAVEKSPEQTEAVAALVARGVPELLAERHVGYADPSLVAAAIVEFDGIENKRRPPAAIFAAIFGDPAKFGIEKTQTGWRSANTPTKTREQKDTEYAAELQRRRQESAAMDATRSTKGVKQLQAELASAGVAA
jgi:DNA-binding Lrp family transcriptional regulator